LAKVPERNALKQYFYQDIFVDTGISQKHRIRSEKRGKKELKIGLFWLKMTVRKKCENRSLETLLISMHFGHAPYKS